MDIPILQYEYWKNYCLDMGYMILIRNFFNLIKNYLDI